MQSQEIEKLVADEFDKAFKETEHPHKFFLTENGRHIQDGGELYNAVLKDALDVTQKATVEILKKIK